MNFGLSKLFTALGGNLPRRITTLRSKTEAEDTCARTFLSDTYLVRFNASFTRDYRLIAKRTADKTYDLVLKYEFHNWEDSFSQSTTLRYSVPLDESLETLQCFDDVIVQSAIAESVKNPADKDAYLERKIKPRRKYNHVAKVQAHIAAKTAKAALAATTKRGWFGSSKTTAKYN